MKKFLIACSMTLAVVFATNSAKAQVGISDPSVDVAVGNLINIQNVDVNVVIQDVLNNVQIQDVIDVQNVLNNADIDILNNVLNNLSIDNVLNNLLRDANIITGNQVVVGVVVNALSGAVEQVLVADRAVFGNKRPKK